MAVKDIFGIAFFAMLAYLASMALSEGVPYNVTPKKDNAENGEAQPMFAILTDALEESGLHEANHESAAVAIVDHYRTGKDPDNTVGAVIDRVKLCDTRLAAGQALTEST